MRRVTVVVPTVRDRAHVAAFLAAWAPRWARHRPGLRVVLVEDQPEPTFDAGPDVDYHGSWEDIDRALGADAWVVPRLTDGVRAFGFWLAARQRADVVITLDDDCFPRPGDGDFVDAHVSRLLEDVEDDAWVSTVDGPPPRGFPYAALTRRRPVAVNHGLWSGVPDLDAPSTLARMRASARDRVQGGFAASLDPRPQTIPVGRFFPMSAMNVSFRAAALPAALFPPMGRDAPYDRFGDIWAGVLVKRVADHLGWAVRSGAPVVEHRRASNVWANLRKEAAGLEANETFWQRVAAAPVSGETFGAAYASIARAFERCGDDYLERTARAMLTWVGLFDGERDA